MKHIKLVKGVMSEFTHMSVDQINFIAVNKMMNSLIGMQYEVFPDYQYVNKLEEETKYHQDNLREIKTSVNEQLR